MKKWYAVLGDPISQSMSPAMHDLWFEENNLDATYIPLHVTENDLEEAVSSLKRLGCSGWNVTVPHKTAIIPFLDELDASAKIMNAVNTVEVLADGTLRGSNTDGKGFVRSLEEVFGNQCKDGEVLIIGAGGAARGIAYALQEAGYGPLTFTNRTIENAIRLAEGMLNTSVVSLAEAEQDLAKYGLIVQTTSVGMNYARQGVPLSPDRVGEHAVVADIIYNPLETEFLSKAHANGANILNGVGMFVHQGALSFEKWIKIQPNTEKMIEEITVKLGG